MAYPFVQFPTLSDFIGAAKEKYGCRLVEETVFVRGKGRTVHLLQGKDKKHRVSLPDYSKAKNVRLTPERIRHLCRRLKIPVKEWLPLG